MAGSKWQEWSGTVVACGLLAVATSWVTIQFLKAGVMTVGEQEPLEFSKAVLEQENPFLSDLMAAREAVEKRWSYLEHRTEIDGFDLDRSYREALVLLGTEPDEHSFADAMRHLTASLHDGHAYFQRGEFIKRVEHAWPVALVETKEGFVVDQIADLSEHGSDSSVIQRGDLMLTVDDRPVEAYVQDAMTKVYASTDLARRRMALAYAVAHNEASWREFKLQRPNGDEYTAKLPCLIAFQALEASAPPRPERQHRMLENQIGYFCPGDFQPPRDSEWSSALPEDRDGILAEVYADFDRRIGELSDARALILDLRGNPGGTDLLGQFLVDRLVKGSYTYFKLSAQGLTGWRGFSSHGSSAPKGKHDLYGIPLVVITDSFTFSTADNVASCLRDVHPDVTFVGRPNGAGSGAPRPHTLPHTGSSITFCTQRVQSASGRMNEGVSVAIDIPVQWSRDDMLSDRDPDLQAAIAAATASIR